MMTLSDKQILFAQKLGLLLIEASRQNIPVKITELYRTLERQKLLVAKKLSKTLFSKHLKGLAADLAIIKDGQYIINIEGYRPLGEYWESLGNTTWGGNWNTLKDGVHFELDETNL